MKPKTKESVTIVLIGFLAGLILMYMLLMPPIQF